MYCRGLVHLFCYRCLEMWSADCRHFTSEKTNITLLLISLATKELVVLDPNFH
ncbi:putative transcription factor interactor and regulator CCHC(Zn) family [Helianthus anomalus]